MAPGLSNHERFTRLMICAGCLQPNEVRRIYCWQCGRYLAQKASNDEYGKILGLKASWNMQDLETAYRQVADKFHPDKNPGNAEASVKLAFINEAYEVLKRLGGATEAVSPSMPAAASVQEVKDSHNKLFTYTNPARMQRVWNFKVTALCVVILAIILIWKYYGSQ